MVARTIKKEYVCASKLEVHLITGKTCVGDTRVSAENSKSEAFKMPFSAEGNIEDFPEAQLKTNAQPQI